MVDQGYLRVSDIPPILGVTKQRVSQIVAEREDFPKPAKVIGRHRLWRRKDVERWLDASLGFGSCGSEIGSPSLSVELPTETVDAPVPGTPSRAAYRLGDP